MGSSCLKLPEIPGSGCLFSSPFSVSSFSGTPIMQMLFCLMWSHRSLKLSSLLKILFSFCCSVWVSPTALSSNSHPFFCSSGLLLNRASMFYRSVVMFFSSVTSVWYFLIVSVSLLKFSLYLSIHIPSSVSIFVAITLNSSR